MAANRKRSSWIWIAIIGGVSLGIAWQNPNSLQASVFGWIATFFLLLTVRSKYPHRASYLYGLVFQPFGFYWLFYTINHFGHFGTLPTALIFGLFVVLSALQFVVFSVIYHALPKWCTSAALAGAIAWVSAELVSVRIFPWHLGHTQIYITELIQIADIGGSLMLSFLMVWVVDGLLSARRSVVSTAVPVAALGLSFLYGVSQIPKFESGTSQTVLEAPIQVTLVQGNVSLEEKHDTTSFRENMRKYYQLSQPYAQKSDLIIWPETSMMEWISSQVGSVRNDPRIPFFPNGATLMLGTPTFADRETFYNSVVAVLPDGSVSAPYHKRILMPFGEYTPFGDLIPWIKELNSTAADFTAGTEQVPFQIPLRTTSLAEKKTTKVSSLICYEDIVQSMGREATLAGAEVIVNQTNDAWFGDTIAPYQHHALAVLRAVENRRYLLRVTNTGLTAVVTPVGKTLSQLPTYSTGALHETVHAIRYQTPFTSWVGNYPWWLLTFFSACVVLAQGAIKGKQILRKG